jgi:hypothetical protein
MMTMMIIIIIIGGGDNLSILLCIKSNSKQTEQISISDRFSLNTGICW